MRLCEFRADMIADRILDAVDNIRGDVEADRAKVERLKARAAEVAPWRYGNFDPERLFTVAHQKVDDRFVEEAGW
jgi:hypothetical protein